MNFLIAFLATCIGAMTGVGGGVIIKPVMDLVGTFDAGSIGVLSSITVFAMAISSCIKQFMAKTKIDMKIAVALAIGSLIGGNIGQQILTMISSQIDPKLVTSVQNCLLALVILMVYIYMQKKDSIKSLGLTSVPLIFVSGVLLGTMSAFLGIGGGPINVAVIIFAFGLTGKEAAVYSVVAILFSQFSKLALIGLTTGYSEYNLTVAPVMIVAGIVGGLIGSKYNKKLDSKTIEKCFSIVQIFIILTAVLNIARGFMG